MGASIRQRWDSVNDCRDLRPVPAVETHAKWRNAVFGSGSQLEGEFRDIPAYRSKYVRLPNGKFEISVTPANTAHVINARMGFNPLLDLPRKSRTDEEQERRDDENRQRAAKRAKQKVRYLVKSMWADHMLTFSYREYITDRALVAAHWKEFCRLFHKRYPEWHYVAALETQERGSIHLHVAVQGKQDIRWLLRCWLLAIGQSPEEVTAWQITGHKLGDKSLGAVNVEPPKKRWGGGGTGWKADKLSGYLTKYIGKEFEEAEKSAKKYWASRNIPQPVIERFWLRAKTYAEAVIEAHDLIYFAGASSINMWGDDRAGVLWLTGETERERLGQCTQIPVGDLEEFDCF